VSSATYYITTPIYYVNDLPHIGHIYTTVVADTIARYKRARGLDVRFLTGTDEHGQNVERAARAQGLEPKALADRVVSRYHTLWDRLGVTHDDFIRTTDERHARGVVEMIRRIEANGDLYVAAHEGWYCSSCEAFYTEKELGDERLCPTHERPAEWHSEENVFFRLSAYQDRLLAHYRDNREFIRPKSRYNEVKRFVEAGLRDLSISRVSLSWGIPFPQRPGHVVYVWLDALTNYISALGFGSPDGRLVERYWPADLHLVGKDILRFHCVFWPAFLMSAGLPLPKQVFGHGWWLRDERKMSKSTGNLVRPDYLIDRFGADPLRYFLLREMTFGQDANFSDEGFLGRYNGDLANGLGNALSRVVAMAGRYFAGSAPPIPCESSSLRETAGDVVLRYVDAMDALEFHRALDSVWELVAAVDAYVGEKAPWTIAKNRGTDAPELSRVLYNCLEALRLVAVMVAPVMPQVSTRMLAQLGIAPGQPEAASMAWGGLRAGAPLGEASALFPRVDVDAFFEEVKVTEESSRSAQSAAAPAAEADTQKVAVEPATATQGEIGIDEFARVQLRVGTVTLAERVPKSNKLVRIEVDLGEGRPRQVVAGIGTRYEPEKLVGRQIVVVANLKPAKLMGVASQGMLLAATLPDGGPVLLAPEAEVPNGSGVK